MKFNSSFDFLGHKTNNKYVSPEYSLLKLGKIPMKHETSLEAKTLAAAAKRAAQAAEQLAEAAAKEVSETKPSTVGSWMDVFGGFVKGKVMIFLE